MAKKKSKANSTGPHSARATSRKEKNTPLVVGVGASAGGLEAFREFLSNIPPEPGFAIVFVQHLDPDNRSLLAEILPQVTDLAIVEPKRATVVKADTVYLAPAGKLLEIKDGSLRINKQYESAPPQIDHFFHSLAEDCGSMGVGIIVSGAGTDGTLGLKAISDTGGLTFAQEPTTARFDSMPGNAANTGVADHVLPPAEIAAELTQYAKHVTSVSGAQNEKSLLNQIVEAVPSIAEVLVKETGHNFQHYRSTTLARRIRRRMQVLKIGDVDEYVSVLEKGKEEASQLFRELLIGVTSFFRDPEVFEELATSVLPKILDDRRSDEPVRIWVTGCATGEEAYTIAILCTELMETIDNRPEVQIFASDIDERALKIARGGAYPVGIKENVSPERLKRFFTKQGKKYHVNKEIRELVLFSAHNLISDPPFSRLDLISCRNLLIYLGPHLQKKLIPVFHYALRPSGFLLLGPSENKSGHRELFRTINAKFRISQSKATGAAPSPGGPGLRVSGGHSPQRIAGRGDENSDDLSPVLQRILLDEFAPKSAVVDEDGQIICTSGDMQKYLTVGGGKFQNNILKMARSGLRIGLRAALNEAHEKRRRVIHEDLSVQIDDMVQRVMLTVQPMPELGEESGLFMIVFQDIGRPFDRAESSDVAKPGRQADAESIKQLERELQTTREDLEHTMQEMDATNEELKSSNEELLSMNEELQSANEELETSKEEIKAGSTAVARARDDLENLLRSTNIATIFLDNDYNIKDFTPAAREIYGLIETDVGRAIRQLMPLADSMPELPVLESLTADEPVEHSFQTISGKWFIRRAMPYLTHTGEIDGMVLIFVDVSELRLNEVLLQRSLQAADMDAIEVDLETGQILRNGKLLESLGLRETATIEEYFSRVHPGDLNDFVAKIRSRTPDQPGYRHAYRFKADDGKWRWLQDDGEVYFDDDDKPIRTVGSCRDITVEQVARLDLQRRERQAAALANLGRTALRCESLDELFDQAVQFVAESLDNEMCKVLQLLPDGAELLLLAGVGWNDGLVGNATVNTGMDSQAGYTLQSREPIVVTDLRRETRFHGPALLTDHDVVSGMSVIIGPPKQPWGVLGTHTRCQFDFSAQDVEFFQAVANLLWSTIQKLRYEQQLVDKTTQLETLADAIPLMVAIVDEKRILKFVNKTYRNEFQAPRDLLIGRSIDQGLHSDVLELGDPHIESVLNGEPQDFEKDLLVNDRMLVSRVQYIPRINDGAVTGFFVLVQDITQQRINEMRLTSGRDVSRILSGGKSVDDVVPKILDSLRTNLNVPVCGIWLPDEDHSRLQCAWISATHGDPNLESFVHQRQKTRLKNGDGMPGRVWQVNRTVWWKDIADDNRFIRKHSAKKAGLIDAVAIRVNGAKHEFLGVIEVFSDRDLSETGVVEMLHEVGRELSAFIIQQQLDDKIHDQQARQSAVLSAALDCIITMDTAGRIVDYNAAAESTFGWSTTEAVGKCLADLLVPAEDRPKHEAGIKRFLETGHSNILGKRLEMEAQRKDGSRFPIELAISVSYMRNGSPFFTGYLRDITDRREAELKHVHSEQLAQQANEAKSEFLANMSHEIRTPMSAIMGYADILARHLKDPDNVKCVEIISDNGHYLLQIINDILDISKIEAGKLETVRQSFRLDRLLADIKSLMQVRAVEKLLDFNVEIQGSLPKQIVSDSKRLKQILVNLIGNAIKFTETGSVRLVVNHHAEPELMVRFEVIDTGIGMSAEVQARLFQPFSQADASVDRKFGGTGLGLAISRRLADMLGGGITVDSKPDVGSTFTLTIPTGNQKTPESFDAVSWERPTKKRKTPKEKHLKLNGRILVVDDRREIRFIAQHFIEDAGGTVETCENGQEAIESVERCAKAGEPFDIVVLDMQMPVMDGYEATRQLRTAGFEKPIIALTAHAMEGDRKQCLDVGCTDYIAKPLDGPRFVELLAAYLQQKNRRQAWNRADNAY